MNEPALSLTDLQARIAKHAWEDPAFEAEFMADPRATFQKHLGQALPPTLTIHAHYNTPTELHFVLPKRELASGELTDDDLERVSGGEVIVVATILLSVVATATIGTTIAAIAEDGW